MTRFTLGKTGLIAMAIAAASSANALTVSTTKTWAMSDSYSSSANTTSAVSDYFSGSTQLLFDQFDASLGTLNSVTVTYNGLRIYTRAEADFRDDDWANETAGYQSIYGGMGGSISGAGFSFSRSSSTRTDTCADGWYATSGAACGTDIYGSYYYPAGTSSTTSSASLLTAFTGNGVMVANFNLGGRLYTNETDGDDGYITYRYGYVYGDGSMTIAYDYTPVPVPAAAWLFGSALFGLATVGRKRTIDNA